MAERARRQQNLIQLAERVAGARWDRDEAQERHFMALVHELSPVKRAAVLNLMKALPMQQGDEEVKKALKLAERIIDLFHQLPGPMHEPLAVLLRPTKRPRGRTI